MEFWGVEVKRGEPLKVESGCDYTVHLSLASLGVAEIGNPNEPVESVYLNVKVDDRRFVLGTLSSNRFPQISFHLFFDKDFELSHSWENGSVHFTGYTIPLDTSDDSSDEDILSINVDAVNEPRADVQDQQSVKLANGEADGEHEEEDPDQAMFNLGA